MKREWLSRTEDAKSNKKVNISGRDDVNAPARVLAMERLRNSRAMVMISLNGMDPLCLMFFTFLRSRGGSLSARSTRDEAPGHTSMVALRFWQVSLQVTERPFQSLVAFWISSPTFLGDIPRGPILGAREEPPADDVSGSVERGEKRVTGKENFMLHAERKMRIGHTWNFTTANADVDDLDLVGI